MIGLRPIGKIVADLLRKLNTSTATSEALEANGVRPRMFPAEIDGAPRDRGAA